MKYSNYILFLIILNLTSCGSNQENSQTSSSHKKHPDSVIRQDFDKKILYQNKQETLEMASFTQKDLDELATQKIQQYFDMLKVIKHKEPHSSFKNYTEKYARKLWLNPEKAVLFSQKTTIKTADSLVLRQLVLINLKENNPQELIGTYRLSYKLYKNRQSKTHQTNAEIFFDIINLSLNGKIYQTIKAKILSID